jgi:DNA-binding NtrC family response regulator
MNADFKPKIILVDDEPGVLSALKLLLTALGYSVFDFIDPRAALDFASTTDSKEFVIVSDLRMPHLDGIELIKSIRNSNLVHKFILMSGHATGEDIANAKECGANYFLSKPFTPEQFRTAIKEVITF